ncbi:MAG: GNAT family N-acetyltransferase [Candidatus Gracilibacteria bacterium]|nr:GNAT family N-acetyltransferase [Candidatus Gracilibacteria bacterium]
MEISIANSETENKECFQFIKNMWKIEFNIDLKLGLDEQYQSFLKSNVYYIKGNGKLLGVIQLAKIKKGEETKDGIIPKEDCYFLWRVGILKESRKKGYGTKLIKYSIEKIKQEGIKLVYLSSEIRNISYYSKFGFSVISGKEKIIGNTIAVHMEKKLGSDNN